MRLGLSHFRLALLACLLPAGQAYGQTRWEQGGFLEESLTLYPRRPNPSDTHSIGAASFQLWARSTLSSRLSLRGSFDLRLDTHHDIDRRRWTDLSQRGLRQPAGALRELYLDLKLTRFDLRLGKQEIRWGRADGFNPTDNLIPYEYLELFADQRIAVPMAKADLYLGRSQLEAVWMPVYTPTRLPILGQRWFPQLPETAQIPVVPGGPLGEVDLSYQDGLITFPARTLGNSQWGLRWNQLARRAEFSVSYFHGFDDIAFFRARATPLETSNQVGRPQYVVSLNREFYRVHVAGVDFASELGPFGIRGEAAFFDRTDPENRDHLLFILGVDKTWGDWFAILQYAGQKASDTLPTVGTFPDLGLRSTLLYRIERTLGPSRTFEIQGAARLRDGDLMIQPEYNVALSNNWRLMLGAMIFAGSRDEFLGQYGDNVNLYIRLRYSF